ncbi:hypothetical protein [Klebsiella pneumoniae]|uniref:hypothetical protein n=1 Tax=Klebsiella pneumoniae TaxID=573 RepID=UPI00388EA028
MLNFMPGEKAVAVVRLITCWEGSETGKAQRCFRVIRKKSGELIDATPFAKKYTSGVLSFAEKELPPGGREKVMASFERVLMPGLEKNQYSILWSTGTRDGLS